LLGTGFVLGVARGRELGLELVDLALAFGERRTQVLDVGLCLRGDLDRGRLASVSGQRRLGRGGARRLRVAQLLDQRVALDDFAAQRGETVAVLLCLARELLGLRAPEVHFFLGELLGAGLGHFELLAQLRDLRALGLGDFLEVTRLLLPTRALGLDGFEPVSQDVELLFELRLRRALALQLLVEIRSTGLRIA
jgi:hypothetical protein